MCVIIHKPAGKTVTLEQLEQCAAKNKDGIGLAWFSQSGSIQVVKGLTVKEVWEIVEPAPQVDFGIHFRLATHGPTSAAMCHPFGISTKIKEVLDPHGSKRILFHNGVIGGFGTSKISDTAHFCQTVLSQISDQSTRRNLLDLTADKFLLMHVDAKNRAWVQRIGNWTTVDGVHFSNLHWQPRPAYRSGYKGGVRTWDNETSTWKEWEFERPRVQIDSSDSRIITGIDVDSVSDDPAVVNAAIESQLGDDREADYNGRGFTLDALEIAFEDAPIDVIDSAIKYREGMLAKLEGCNLPSAIASRIELKLGIERLHQMRTTAPVSLEPSKADAQAAQDLLRESIEAEHYGLEARSIVGE